MSYPVKSLKYSSFLLISRSLFYSSIILASYLSENYSNFPFVSMSFYYSESFVNIVKISKCRWDLNLIILILYN